MAEVKTLYLFRSGVTIARNGASAERGSLVVGAKTFHTIERRGGYVTLPKGSFEIKMEHSPSKKYNGAARKQFRVYGHGVTNNRGISAALLIHLGNYPDHITGCIAPGVTSIANGVGQSNTAMEAIFNYFGGFAIGKTGQLVVDDLVTP